MKRRAPSGKRIPARGASGVVYPISLCMIVRNEERFLAAALTSVQGVVDEICIVDYGFDRRDRRDRQVVRCQNQLYHLARRLRLGPQRGARDGHLRVGVRP